MFVSDTTLPSHPCWRAASRKPFRNATSPTQVIEVAPESISLLAYGSQSVAPTAG